MRICDFWITAPDRFAHSPQLSCLNGANELRAFQIVGVVGGFSLGVGIASFPRCVGPSCAGNIARLHVRPVSVIRGDEFHPRPMSGRDDWS
jgi:hypothetical protein